MKITNARIKVSIPYKGKIAVIIVLALVATIGGLSVFQFPIRVR